MLKVCGVVGVRVVDCGYFNVLAVTSAYLFDQHRLGLTAVIRGYAKLRRLAPLSCELCYQWLCRVTGEHHMEFVRPSGHGDRLDAAVSVHQHDIAGRLDGHRLA